MVTKHGKAAHCRNDCPFLLKSRVIQSLGWCSHCDRNDAGEKARLEAAQWVVRTSFEPPRVFCISSQSHRFLFHSCRHDVPVALILPMTHHFHATRANVSCARLGQASAPLLIFDTKCFRSLCWNVCLRQVILASVRIPHVVSPCETHLLACTCNIRLGPDLWWDWRIVVDSVDTHVLWSERAVGIPGYGTKEENPQTWRRDSTRSTADNEHGGVARLVQTERALIDARQEVAAAPKVTAPLVDTRTIGKAPTLTGEHKDWSEWSF